MKSSLMYMRVFLLQALALHELLTVNVCGAGCGIEQEKAAGRGFIEDLRLSCELGVTRVCEGVAWCVLTCLQKTKRSFSCTLCLR